LLAILPPGAFIAMGFIIALKNVIDTQIKQRQPKETDKAIERVRVNFDS
jgi:electron transport complex protein RnfE